MNKFALKSAAIILLSAFVVAPAFAGDVEAGEGAFKKKCKMCHANKDGAKSGMGPNLFGIMGRKAGSLADFASKYSDGMKAAGVWDDAALLKLIEDPKKFVEGIKMKGGKVTDATQRADIVAYVNTLK